MADAPAPTQAPPSEKSKAATPPPYPYLLKWEPIGEFTEEALFIKGVVRAKVWITEKVIIHYRSLSGEEVDKVNEGIKVTEGMSVAHFKTEQSYWNLAHSIESIADKPFEGKVEEKLAMIRKMAAPILHRILLGYMEFGNHVDDLFVGKGGQEVAKKS